MNLTVSTSGSALSNFGIYQQTSVELSEFLIRTLSAPNLTVRCCSRNSFSTISCHYPILLPSHSITTWLPSYFISLSTRAPLKKRRKPLLSQFSATSYLFRIYMVPPFSILPGNLLRFCTPIFALRMSRIYLSLSRFLFHCRSLRSYKIANS